MTQTNCQDVLRTELGEIQRRLQLLEANAMRQQAAPALNLAAMAHTVPTAVPVPMLPARSADWPATAAGSWEVLSVARVTLGDHEVHVQLHLAADLGTTGAVRVLVDGRLAGEEVPVTAGPPSTHTVAVAEGSVIAVQARRSQGDGQIRIAAVLHAG
jgi:hypothetical protein